MSAKEQKWLPSRRQSYRGNCIKVRRFLYQVPKVCYRDLENCESQGKWPYWGHRCLETRQDEACEHLQLLFRSKVFSQFPNFQNGTSCKTFYLKMSFIYIGIKINFHVKDLQPSYGLGRTCMYLESSQLWRWQPHICQNIRTTIYKKIIAVIVTTFAVAKRQPEKIQACTGLEPLTSAIPVQRSTN